MKHYRDNAKKFKEVYEKPWKPSRNTYNKQSDFVKIFLNSDGYSDKFVPARGDLQPSHHSLTEKFLKSPLKTLEKYLMIH